MRANVDVGAVIAEEWGLDPDFLACPAKEAGENQASVFVIFGACRRELSEEGAGTMCRREKAFVTRVVDFASEHSLSFTHSFCPL